MDVIQSSFVYIISIEGSNLYLERQGYKTTKRIAIRIDIYIASKRHTEN